MLDDIVQDLESEKFVESMLNEPDPPFFAQMSTESPNGIYSLEKPGQNEYSDSDAEQVEDILR